MTTERDQGREDERKAVLSMLDYVASSFERGDALGGVFDRIIHRHTDRAIAESLREIRQAIARGDHIKQD